MLLTLFSPDEAIKMVNRGLRLKGDTARFMVQKLEILYKKDKTKKDEINYLLNIIKRRKLKDSNLLKTIKGIEQKIK